MLKLVVSQQIGSFLLEATIGGALVAGLGMAGASFYKTRRQNQDYLDKLRELNAFHSTLNKLLQNSSHCNATFKPWDRANNVPGSGINDLKRINLCSSGCVETSTAQSVGSTLFLTEATARPTDYSNWLPINVSDGTTFIRRQRNWQIRDIGMVPVNRSGRVNMNIIYELYPNRPDSRRVQKSISLNFKFSKESSPRFISCASEKESSLRSVLEEMCETLNQTTATSGVIASWDSVAQRCVMRDMDVCYSDINSANSGLGAPGLTPTGTMPCSSYWTDIQGSEVFNAEDNDCTGNKVPSIAIGSDGQLRIRCT